MRIWLALLLLPSAGAVELTMDDPGRVEPGVVWSGTLDLAFTCSELLAAGPSPSAPLEVRFDAPAPGLEIGFTGAMEVDKLGCAPGLDIVHHELQINITASMETPSLEEHAIHIEAGLEGGDLGTLDASITSEFVPRITVDAPSRIKHAGPQEQIAYEIHVENHSNARVVVHFQAEEIGAGQLVVPDAIILDMPGGANTATAIAVYATPFENGPNHHEDELRLVAVASHALEPGAKGEPVPIALLARTEGVYVPGPGTLLLPALLVAAALRRRS